MKRLKKVIDIMLVYCFMFTAIPTNALAQTIKVTANNVPYYMEYNEAYVVSAMQYKDKTLLNTDDKGVKYINNGKISTIENITPCTQISDKQFYDSFNNSIFDLETGKISSLNKDVTYAKEKNLVALKYKANSLEYQEMEPIKSVGKVKWSVYRVGFVKNNVYYSKVGVVNSNLKTYEFSTGTEYYDLEYNCYVYKDNFYYINNDNNLIVISANGTSHKYSFSNDLKKAFKDVQPRIYVNKDGIYFRFDKYTENSLNTYLQKVKISNNQVSPASNKIIDIFSQEYSNSMSIDINYNMWTVKDGSVYKLENDSLVEKYQVDKKMNGIYVYDDKHLTVSGYDTEIKKGIYRIINIKK